MTSELTTLEILDILKRNIIAMKDFSETEYDKKSYNAGLDVALNALEIAIKSLT